MGWLVAHMWLLLALAALFGGMVGWALRARRSVREIDMITAQRDAALAEMKAVKSGEPARATANEKDRLSKLEVALAAEREIVADLKSKLATASIPEADEDDGSLTWRNRYLESRVRYLEGKLADADAVSSAADAPSDDELMRLRWRNRYLQGRVKYLEEDAVAALTSASSEAAAPAVSLPEATVEPSAPEPKEDAPSTSQASDDAPDDADGKPPTLAAPRGGEKDDLRQIGGIGPKIEGILNDLGVYHFDQIAAWTRKEVEWVDGYLSFKGRIDRENWISQSELLARGETPPQREKKSKSTKSA
ncbi:MAG: hypothetical protein AAF719_02735 [Pseudomonadota bacterium]